MSRTLLKSSLTSRAELHDVLEAIAVAELLSPSRTVWICAPVVDEISLLDNSAGNFSVIAFTYGRRAVRLSDLLTHLLNAGSTVVVVASAGVASDWFMQKLTAIGRDLQGGQCLMMMVKETIELPGIFGDSYALRGLLKLATGGVELVEQGVTMETDPTTVAEVRARLTKEYGGAA